MSVPLHICMHPGCRRMIPFNQRFCEEHKQDKSKQATNQERMQYEEKELRFYKSTTWTKLSKSFRLRNPTCASCLKRGIIRQAVLVDHIEPIKTAYGWQHRLDESNLQSLCQTCHNAKTAREVAQRRMRSPERSTDLSNTTSIISLVVV